MDHLGVPGESRTRPRDTPNSYLYEPPTDEEVRRGSLTFHPRVKRVAPDHLLGRSIDRFREVGTTKILVWGPGRGWWDVR